MKFIIFTLLVPTALLGQDRVPAEIEMDAIADRIFTFDDTESMHEESLENLALLLTHPLDLNEVTAEQLRFLNLLSEAQVNTLIRHRNETGNFISIYELQSLPSFNAETVQLLLPYVTVQDPHTKLDRRILNRLTTESSGYFLFRYEHTVEPKKGFSPALEKNQRFLGSPGKLYARFRSSRPGDFSVGFTAEKDQGEALAWDPSANQYGMDYVSFHAQVQNKGKIRNLVLGDYQCQFAQGLVWGGLSGLGKGGETITTVRKSNIGVTPYTSAYEAGYLRGIAATVQLQKNAYITGLYAYARRDASLQEAEENQPPISALAYTGLHRNQNELEKRKQVLEQNTGAVFQYQKNNLDAGVLYHRIQFDQPVQPRALPYNQFSFRGSANTNISIYANYTHQNLTFFTEAAHSIGHGRGYVTGSLISLTPALDMSLLYRKYEKDFQPFYSNALAENTTPENETGIYWGWKYRINRKWSQSGYLDIFRFPWLKFRTYAPSAGHEALLRLMYQPSKSTTFFIQARQETKSRNIRDENTRTYLVRRGRKRNYWIHANYQINKQISMKSRVQFSNYQLANTYTAGFVLAQDLRVHVKKIKCTMRYALFDTDDYDNRQYMYENDVWLAFSLPAYYGIGIRKYFLLEYKWNKHLTCWIRYSHTRYTDRKTIGSGLDAIDGNTKNDIKFEARIRF